MKTETPPAKLTDISAIQPKERTIQILGPNDEPLGIKWTLMSADDPRLKKQQRHLLDRKQERERRGKIFKAEEMETATIEYFAAATTDWDWGIRQWNGETPDFTRANVIEVLTGSSMIFNQINDAIGDVKSFF